MRYRIGTIEPLTPSKTRDWNVIGNIYENAELLK